MKQVVQAVSGGPVRVVDVPRPTIGPTEVLVRTVASALSPGTERAVTSLARASLLDKARARPDLVRQVVRKARSEGLAATTRAVRTRLSDDLPLGYSAAGVAVEVGEAVAGVAPGQLVATGGASKATHAEWQAVPGLLCVPVPDGVSAEEAAFTTIAAVALHGLRLAEVGPGARVAVVGLGLLGQLAARLARASGCEVFGLDVDEAAVDRARAHSTVAQVDTGEDTTAALLAWSRGRGADAVVVTAASRSSAVMARVPQLCRDRAPVVVVGDVGLELDRRPFYERELSVRFARSYGPGRYERGYEDWGVDYPAGQVRWTEGRNLEAVLDLLGSGALEVADLITHRFPVEAAPQAYALIDARREPSLGVLLTYPDAPRPEGPIVLRPGAAATGVPGVGLVGAGAFARSVLVPALRRAGFERLVAVASQSGLSARRLAEQAGFERAVSGADAVIEDPDVDVVVIASPHDTHAALAAAALRAGKHVWCEKPLALTDDELDDVEAALAEHDGVLFVGFNRRWSTPVAMVRGHLAASAGPLVLTYRVNAGTLPAGHWYHDRRQGGRLLGEVCHFVDTCAAVVGRAPDRVTAMAGGDDGELLLAENLVVTLGWDDGSVAAITYAAGGDASVDKERLEVLGRGHSASIIDFRRVVLDGREHVIRPQDKGHSAEARAFLAAVRTGDRSAGAEAVASMRACLAAVAGLRSGAGR